MEKKLCPSVIITDGIFPSVIPLLFSGFLVVILEYVSFYVHDFNIMAEEIVFPIRKLLENTSLYPIMGKTKTSKLLLTELEIKHNVTIL